MNIATFAFTVLLAVQATANPFAPVNKNTAETEYISQLLARATPTSNSQLPRDLNQNQNNIDLTGYVVKYDRCQFVQGYSDEEAQSSSSTVLSTSHYVIFRLCPSGTCSSCSSEFGEYLVDLNDYIYYAAMYQTNNQTTVCNLCDECGGDEAVDVDCNVCAEECTKIRNVGSDGIFEATQFTTCKMVFDPDDDTMSNTRYGGVTCASSGGKIKISVFTDEKCENVDTSASIEEYATDADGNIGRISYAIMKTIYNSTNCISCNNNGATSNMCSALYTKAAKCEASHGFATGMVTDQNGYYYNQLMQESLVCSYIESLTAGTYTESGAIIISGANKNTSGGNKTSGGQKFALSFFILGTVGLAVFAGLLHQKLTKGGGKGTLSNQGGALA